MSRSGKDRSARLGSEEESSLAALLIGGLDPREEGDQPDLRPIGAALRRCIETGEARWPSCLHKRREFVRHLAGVLGSAAEPWPDRIEALVAADIYLASAAIQGIDAASEAIHREYGSDVRAALHKVGLTRSQVDEALQTVMATVLVGGPDRPAGISTYAGRGALRSWLRSVAVRTGIKLAQAHGKEPSSDDELLAKLPAMAPDPEIDLLKETYRAEFADAVRAAMAALTRRERTLLRQHFIDGLTARELGKLYEVHHATAARWVNAARERLQEKTKEAMIERLGLAPSEVVSIVRLVRSQIDLSLHEFFATQLPES